jgi:hypothetical protein
MLKKSLNRKSYCRLLEVIGGSTVPLSKSEIMYRMRDIDPASDWRYVYEMLKDLCPTLPGTGRRYFCLDDLISEDPEVQKRASSNLITKIKKDLIYDSLLLLVNTKKSASSKQKDTCRTRIAKNSKQEIKNIIIEDENNNSIRIEPPYSLSIKDKDTPLTVTDYVKLKTVVNKSLSIDRGYLRKKGERHMSMVRIR